MGEMGGYDEKKKLCGGSINAIMSLNLYKIETSLRNSLFLILYDYF